MIPIYRAKKIDTDEWIISGSIRYINNRISLLSPIGWIPCAETTLSIHFPNMLDKNGKKIFASLSEDGIGGDELEVETGLFGGGKKYIEITMYDNCGIHPFTTPSYCDDEQGVYIYAVEVIGIHKGE